MALPILEPLTELADGWRSITRRSRLRLALAAVALATVLALLLARHGTARARVGAAAILVASACAAVGWRWLTARRLRRPEGIVRDLARRVDPQGAARALRALSLLAPDGSVRTDGTSPELATLHLGRVLAQLPADRVLERAARLARRVAAVAMIAALGALLLSLAKGWSVLEGADVLLARGGKGPVTMQWLDDVEVVARPPEYLHENERHEVAFFPMVLPYGTTVTVRGVPSRAGRRLLLGDGANEVPFVDDGAGAQVARWTVKSTTRLHVEARFGSVAVEQQDALSIQSVPDEAPVVTLEGAPRTVRLVDATEDLPIRYRATDDHGLREVHLVLRSGTREERRVLSRLDGETRTDEGGESLRLRDPFLRKSHVPVEITVEAKDNDPLTGPKWGASAAITVLPPDVGEPEARRLDALRKLRDELVDTLAWRLSNDAPADLAARKTFVADERARADGDENRLEDTAFESYGGVRVPARLYALLRAQSQKTRKALDAELRAPTSAAHAAVVKATERWVLVVDAVIRGLGVRDARGSARQLADVADDLTLGASEMQGDTPGELRDAAVRRMDAATTVLAGGGHQLAHLGALGRDLGEIVDADLARVKRARGGDDMTHAELAARDLATRLREPDPSFGARGRIGRAGGESGGAPGAPSDDGDDTGDAVDQAEQEAEQDLERLAQDHAGEMAKMEQALAGAASEDEKNALREEAKRHAQAVRDAVRDLPKVGMGSDSWTSKGAAARELAEQMARSLEDADPDEASQSGRSALGSLDEAKRMLERGGWMEDPDGTEQKHVADARRRLEAEEKWAEQQLAEMRRRAAERARGQLAQGGDEEDRLADRAGELGHRARDGGSLPDQAVESIEDAERAARQAAQALRAGDADRGLDQQRQAQRDLEAARQQLEGDEDAETPSQPSAEDGDGKAGSQQRVNVPKPDEHKGPEEFRRRVVRGLGQPASGALKDAVHRYAEGLLR